MSSTQSLTEYQSTLAESYHSFRQGEGMGDTLHNVVDFLKKNKKIWFLKPEFMSLVKIILVMPATNASSEHTFSALRKEPPYNHVEQLSQSSYDMHSS